MAIETQFGDPKDFPRNRKRQYRGEIAAGAGETNATFWLDPSKTTKINVLKGAETAKVEGTSDTVDKDGVPLVTLEDVDILWQEIDAASTTDYFAKDDGLSAVRINGTPITNPIKFNVTQDGH